MNKINGVLTRGVANILPSKKKLADLISQKKITLYQGFDPTSPNLHLGHWIGLRKLAEFQGLGHKVIFLIGDFTGMIGDPSDKTVTRKRLTKSQVLKNAKNYQSQAEKVLKFDGDNPAEVLFNSQWLSKLSFEDVLELSAKSTVQQMLERDFFQQRIKNEKPIYLHEFLYPLMQAYDSVVMGVDLEIGGNDQLFNMLSGRILMKLLKKKEKYVLAMKLLEDPTGKKMGKTEENAINLNDSAIDIFGKIMAFPDSLIDPGIELLTNLELNLSKSLKPLAAKKRLAFEVVRQIQAKEKALAAKAHFEKTFQKRVPEYKIKIGYQPSLVQTIAGLETVGSKSQAKRLIEQGAVDVNEKTIYNPAYKIKGGENIKIGKRVFIQVSSRRGKK